MIAKLYAWRFGVWFKCCGLWVVMVQSRHSGKIFWGQGHSPAQALEYLEQVPITNFSPAYVTAYAKLQGWIGEYDDMVGTDRPTSDECDLTESFDF